MTGIPKSKRAFTLIELLVVIAIIALLAAIAIPSLTTARRSASGTVCLSNQKQLSAAWLLYATDNANRLVGGSTCYSGGQPTPYRWVERPLFCDSDNPETDPVPEESEYCAAYRLNGIRAGRLFVYMQDESLYRCPEDRDFTKRPEPYASRRSYAISGLMNGQDFDYRRGDLYSEIEGYSSVECPDGTRTLVCVTRSEQIQAPARKYVFVEERFNGDATYNLGSFMLMENARTSSWWDYPADYHNNRSTLAFADGHVEMHQWTDPRTLELIDTGAPPVDLDQPENADLEWMIEGYIPRR